jgi:hypothetical protein
VNDAPPHDPFASRRVPDRRFPGGRFVNLHGNTSHTLAEVWRWRANRRPPPWPDRVEDPWHPPPRLLPPGRIGATFIGQATWLLQIGGVAILTDPIWSDRASPLRGFGPRRVRRPGQVLDALPKVELLLVSHNHYDHLDLPTLRAIARRWDPPALTPTGNAKHLARAGITARELDWWAAEEVAGLRVTCVPAQHFSARQGGTATATCGAASWWRRRTARAPTSPATPPGARTCRRSAGASRASTSRCCRSAPMRRAGSSGRSTWTPRRRCARIWHSGAAEPRDAFRHLRGMTDEPWDEPPRRLAEARAAHGVAEDAFVVPEFGATYEFGVGPA